MTMLDPHLDVDQLSAAVDGDRDPAVAAHLLTCLSCREQVDAWSRALAPLRDLPAAPPDVEGMIEVALAGWTAAPGRPSVVTPLPARPARPHRWRHLRPPPALAAALVGIVLLAAAVLGVHAAGGGSSSSSASKSSSGALQAAPRLQVPSATSTGAASSSAPTSTGAATPRSALSSLAGTAALAAQLRRVTAAPGATKGAAPDTPCLSQARRLATVSPAVADASPSFTEAIRLADVDDQVFVFAGAQHQQVALVLRLGTCALLTTVLF
jgi:hypothetical protein